MDGTNKAMGGTTLEGWLLARRNQDGTLTLTCQEFDVLLAKVRGEE